MEKYFEIVFRSIIFNAFKVMNIRHQTDGPNPENFLNVPNTAAGPVKSFKSKKM